MVRSKLEIEILCHCCKNTTKKKFTYLQRRIRENKTKFFCSRQCADEYHSINMLGENNPNYNGKWNGPPVHELFTMEQLRSQGLTAIENMKNDGTYKERMRKLQEAHQVYFSTEEGKRKRQEIAVKSILSQASGKKRTSIEIKMADELTRRGIEYLEQYNLGGKFVLDFFIPDFDIVIECDGDYWHRLPHAIEKDKRKNAYINACDYSLYRFWETEINTDVEACVDIVLAEINESEAI